MHWHECLIYIFNWLFLRARKENIRSRIYTRLKLVPVCSWHHAFLVVSCLNQVNITLACAVCCETGTSPGLFSFPWFGHTQATFTLRCMTCWKVWLRFVAYFNSQAFSHNPVLAALVGETLCKQSVGLLPHMKLKAEWVLYMHNPIYFSHFNEAFWRWIGCL